MGEQDGTMSAFADPFSLCLPSVWTWQVNRPKGVVPGSVAAPQSTAQDACVSGQDITEDATPNLPTGAEGEPATTLPSAFTWSLGKTMLLSPPQDPSSMGAFERLFTNMH